MTQPAQTVTGPAYRLETERLVIRCWHPVDAPLLKAAIDASLTHLRTWMPWAVHEPSSLAEKIERLRLNRGNFDLGQNFIYGIFNQTETQVLGGIGLHPIVGQNAREIGYWIHQDYVRQGLGTEAAAALTKVAFVIERVDRVEIHCDPKNRASAAIPYKLGFPHEATLKRRDLTPDGQPRDTMIWSLFAADYPTSPAAEIQLTAYNVVGEPILS